VIPRVVAVEVSDFIIFVHLHGYSLFPIVAISKGNGFHQGIAEIVPGSVIGANGTTGALPFVEVSLALGAYLGGPPKRFSAKRTARSFRFSIGWRHGPSLKKDVT
jgi:hypothetical protein